MPSENPKNLQYQFERLMSELYPLRGKEALAELDRVTTLVRENAKHQGLTEEKLNQLLNKE